MKKFEGREKVAKVENGKVNQYIGTEYDSEDNYLTFNLWERGDKKRIYINDYKGRSCGYIDLNDANRIETENRSAEETAVKFLAEYAI